MLRKPCCSGPRTDPDSELTLKQCGETSLAVKLAPDCVVAGNVDVYRMTSACNIPDPVLSVIADSFLHSLEKLYCYRYSQGFVFMMTLS